MLLTRAPLAENQHRNLLAGAAGSLALGVSVLVSVTGTSASAQVAQVSSASAVTQTTPAGTCESGSECTGVDLYGHGGADGGALAPGDSVTSTARFDSEDSGATGLVLDPAPCAATTKVRGQALLVDAAEASGSLCSVLQVSLYRGPRAVGRPVYRGTLAGFDAPMSFRVSGNPAFTFVVRLPTSATAAVQGQQVSQPLSWAFRR